jgi:hypothetical protein
MRRACQLRDRLECGPYRCLFSMLKCRELGPEDDEQRVDRLGTLSGGLFSKHDPIDDKPILSVVRRTYL